MSTYICKYMCKYMSTYMRLESFVCQLDVKFSLENLSPLIQKASSVLSTYMCYIRQWGGGSGGQR